MGKISIVFDTKNSKKTLETSDESEAKSFVIDNIKKADLENVKIEIHKISTNQTHPSTNQTHPSTNQTHQ